MEEEGVKMSDEEEAGHRQLSLAHHNSSPVRGTTYLDNERLEELLVAALVLGEVEDTLASVVEEVREELLALAQDLETRAVERRRPGADGVRSRWSKGISDGEEEEWKKEVRRGASSGDTTGLCARRSTNRPRGQLNNVHLLADLGLLPLLLKERVDVLRLLPDDLGLASEGEEATSEGRAASTGQHRTRPAYSLTKGLTFSMANSSSALT